MVHMQLCVSKTTKCIQRNVCGEPDWAVRVEATGLPLSWQRASESARSAETLKTTGCVPIPVLPQSHTGMSTLKGLRLHQFAHDSCGSSVWTRKQVFERHPRQNKCSNFTRYRMWMRRKCVLTVIFVLYDILCGTMSWGITTLGPKVGRFENFLTLWDKNEAQKRVFREKLTLDTTCWLFGTVCERYFTSFVSCEFSSEHRRNLTKNRQKNYVLKWTDS